MSGTGRLTLDIGGVVVALDVPAGWLPLLYARYVAFVADEAPAWRVTLVCDPEVIDADPGWIEHTGLQSRFHVLAYKGSVDLAARVASISAPSQDRAFSAVERILVYVCMQTLPREHTGLLLHACGVVHDGAGDIFVGPSGAGKTTVARLAAGYGNVLGDENVIVRLDAAQPMLWSTPFWGFSTPPDLVARSRAGVPLRAVYVLVQASGFRSTRLNAGQAIMALLDSQKVAVERPESAAAWLAVAERLVSYIPIYRLEFRPMPELWAFLRTTY